MKFVIPFIVIIVFPCLLFVIVQKVANRKFAAGLCALSLLLSNIFSIAVFCLQPSRNVCIFFSHVLNPTFKFWIQYSVLIFPFSILFALGQIKSVGDEEKVLSKKHFLYNLVLIFLTSFLAFAFIWAAKRFPIYEPEIVYFTITRPVAGGTSGIAESLVLEVLLPSLAVLLIAGIFVFLSCRYAKHKYQINLGKFKFIINGGGVFIYALLYVFIEISGWKYFKIVATEIQKPVFSEFYEENYVPPQNVKITFPEKKKNLLYIVMESMESSFADFSSGGVFEKNYIPNLTALANANINFSHTEKVGGGFDATGTGWTVAAMLAKFSGLPFALPMSGNPEKLKRFLPCSVMLTDILNEAGYNTRFIFGSDKAFASRDALLETHGCEVHDINWYKEQNLLDKNYSVFWGFEDAKLYDFAKVELADLAAKADPFMFGLLTVDTHFPDGYICQLCFTEYEGTDRQIFPAVECADRQIAEFLAWAETQSWYEETTIVIAGDHLFMQTGDRDIFNVPQNYKTNTARDDFSAVQDSPRRWIDIFINSEIEAASVAAKTNRKFSSFDMLPTVLESIGAEIEGHALGFGRSLFTGEPTIFEQFDESYVNEQISKRCVQYSDML